MKIGIISKNFLKGDQNKVKKGLFLVIYRIKAQLMAGKIILKSINKNRDVNFKNFRHGKCKYKEVR